eukprot:5044744-Lingulodinium_polyedra.AAC.1
MALRMRAAVAEWHSRVREQERGGEDELWQASCPNGEVHSSLALMLGPHLPSQSPSPGRRSLSVDSR